MAMKTDKELKAFLVELSLLSNKYDLWLGSCGCCLGIFAEPNKEDHKLCYKAKITKDGALDFIETTELR